MARYLTRHDAVAMDRADDLAGLRGEFFLPEGVIYLDGNSLGALPKATAPRLIDVIEQEWGHGLIRSWNVHGWVDLPLQAGAAIAQFVGADSDEVVVTDSISVNIFKLLVAALRLRPGRTVVVSELDNFPSDLYMVQGLADLLQGRVQLRVVRRDQLAQAIDENVAVVMLSHVDFRTGELHDMATWTAVTHQAGSIALWDVAHSVGVVPIELHACDVDFAVGCGYKFLNGGPGAPSFVYAARRLHEDLQQPLWGWFGHAAPFQFGLGYNPAPGIARFQVGTPPVLSLAALASGVEVLARVGVERLRAKSMALTDLFIRLMEQECAGLGFELASPLAPERRGSHVAYRHAQAHPIAQALIARDIIPDFRAPDLLRFGLAPAYLRFIEVWDAVTCLREIVDDRLWDNDEYRRRHKVT